MQMTPKGQSLFYKKKFGLCLKIGLYFGNQPPKYVFGPMCHWDGSVCFVLFKIPQTFHDT